MACDEIIYKGNKYSEEEFVEMMNSGEVPVDGEIIETKPLTNDMEPEKTYIADKSLGINEMRAAYKAEKERVLALGARIQIDNDSRLTYILPKQSDVFYQSGDKGNIVKATMKSVEVAQTPQSVVNWSKLQKGSISLEQFLNNSQFPKEQKALLKDIYENEHPKSLEDLITSLVAKYSYTVEINTAKTAGGTDRVTGEEVQLDGKWFRKVRGQ